MSSDIKTALRNTQRFGGQGILINFPIDERTQKKHIELPCPFCSYEIRGTLEDLYTPLQHRKTEAVYHRLKKGAHRWEQYLILNLDCPKRGEVKLMLEAGPFQHAIEGQGITWWNEFAGI